MTTFILRAYDFLVKHRRLCFFSFIAITCILIGLLFRINFKEDISAFLPLDMKQQKALAVFQDVSGASKVLAIFQYNDSTTSEPDDMVEAIERFKNNLEKIDTAKLVRNLVTEFDLEKLTEITDFVYYNIPYFLTEDDYQRMDSLLSQPNFVSDQLESDKQMLMFPTSGFLSANLQKDPLNIFSPIISKLKRNQTKGFEMYDGHIFTADMSRAIVMMESPFGNSETQNNAILMRSLQEVADSVNNQCPHVNVHYIGGPSIAVANASQIKADSIVSIIIALVLIITLLVITIRKFWNILLIVISVGWGWLFAIGMMAIVNNQISLIVVGISSIILGIAVNYPLHLIAHTSHTLSMRQVLREIIAPLIIGNITTVGAFLTLIPLQATALRDLGIFSAFILIGTILFVVFYLPHAVKTDKATRSHSPIKRLDWLSNLTLENKKGVAVIILLFTCVFAYYSTQTKFDTNMSHINYMTQQQRADMEYFSSFTAGESNKRQCVYVVSDGNTIENALNSSSAIQAELTKAMKKYDKASISSCYRFLPSSNEQKVRIERWNAFINKHKDLFDTALTAQSIAHGFLPNSFDEFSQIIHAEYPERSFTYFTPLSNINSSNLSIDSINNTYRVIDAIYVTPEQLNEAKTDIERIAKDRLCFDVQSLNSSLANGLSDNFNYIGWACGLIVFFFLWFSFNSIELALLSFLPMAVSWIWILGIMAITDIQFNIVNIILATFIFGQGDDYTIFMTEGSCYEYAYRKKMLASYKRSIIISALIMFIGIGTLILAKHPALHSLAEVTIVGMFSVVLMAYLLPPLVFKWITKKRNEYRMRPLTLMPMLRAVYNETCWILQSVCIYGYRLIFLSIFSHNQKTENRWHKFVTHIHRFGIGLMSGIKLDIHNPNNEQLEKPCLIICNHTSLLASIPLLAWNSQIVIVLNGKRNLSSIERLTVRCLNLHILESAHSDANETDYSEHSLNILRNYIAQGYSIAILDKEDINSKSDPSKRLKAPFLLAQQLEVDILPVLIHGIDHIISTDNFSCYGGTVNMEINERWIYGSRQWNNDTCELATRVYTQMEHDYSQLCKRYGNSAYFKNLVIDRYRYKGTEILTEVSRNMKKTGNYSEIVDRKQSDTIIILHSGYGELPLLLSLVHPDVHILAYEADEEKRTVAKYSADGLVHHVEYFDMQSFDAEKTNGSEIYDLSNMKF